MELKEYLAERKQIIESFLKDYFIVPISPALLREAMLYSLMAGGKRIRPVLCMAAYETCGGTPEDILPQAAALELIHTYSLIHDDLPAMDNDDLRRGKPTNHKVYGEAIAILAGDGLLTEAFHMFSKSEVIPSNRIMEALGELAASAGIYGMVSGQVVDIMSEGKDADAETLQFIHRHKTAALLKASIRIGGILYGMDEAGMKSLSIYGDNIGHAFQVVDDILDVTGTTEELGKPKGSDDSKHKMTYPALYGIERSRQIAARLIEDAVKAVAPFGEKAIWFNEIAYYLLKRTN